MAGGSVPDVSHRVGAFLATVLLVVGLFAAVPSGAAGADANVAITSVTTSVENPAPRERFVLRATVENRASSAGPMRVSAALEPGTQTTYTYHVTFPG